MDAIVADWGEVPALSIPLPLGTSRAQVSRLLRSVGEGRALPALCTTRALHLWALPFPDEGAEAVIVYFDDAGCLADVFDPPTEPVFGEYFPEPGQLAFLLEERLLHGEATPNATGLRSCAYHIGELNCTVSVILRGAGLACLCGSGAWPRGQVPCETGRVFRAAHLDRTFEQDRIRLAPEQPGEKDLTITGKALAEVRNPLPALKLTQAELRRESGHNLASALVLRYAESGGGPPPLHQVALPLWVALGWGQMQGVSDENGGHLALVWQDAHPVHAAHAMIRSSPWSWKHVISKSQHTGRNGKPLPRPWTAANARNASKPINRLSVWHATWSKSSWGWREARFDKPCRPARRS